MVDKSLHGYYQNVRGLRTKSHDFLAQVAIADYDFICLTETWLTEDFYDREYFDSRYAVYRADRSAEESGAERGGGVAIAVRAACAPLRRDWPVPPRAAAEALWVSVPLGRGRLGAGGSGGASGAGGANRSGVRASETCSYLNIACVYIPHGPGYRDALVSFLDLTSQIVSDRPDDTFLLCGDFNISDAQWVETTSSEMSLLSNGNFITQSLEEFLSFSNLQQYNNVRNSNSRILDLVLSNTKCIITSSDYPLTAEDAHHPAFLIDVFLDYVLPLKPAQKQIPNFHEGNYEEINSELLKINWLEFFGSLNVEECASKFYNLLNTLISQFIPLRKLRSSCSLPAWYTRPLIKLLKEKRKYHKLWKMYRNPLDYDTFSMLRKRSCKMERECHANYTQYAETKINSHPQFFLDLH